MSTEHVVVPVGECSYAAWGGEACLSKAPGRCNGCLGDGRRALLDQAVAVERSHSDSGGWRYYVRPEVVS